MKSIDGLVRDGGVLGLPRGFLKRNYDLVLGDDTVGHVGWEKAPLGRAFFDTSEARYEITTEERSRLTCRRTIAVRRSGDVIAELHSNWRGNEGDVITATGHRFSFRTVGDRYRVEREVGHEQVLTISRRGIRTGRQVVVSPTHLAVDEVCALLAAMLYHALALDYAADKRALAAGGAAGGG